VRAFLLLACALGLLGLAGFVFAGSPFAAPVALAGAASVLLATV
jgi:hypothetical protein